MTEPRYILRESSGYRINLPARYGGGNTRTVEWLICDRWYAHRVVWRFTGWPSGSGSVAHRRRRAVNECARLNDEHDAWLARSAVTQVDVTAGTEGGSTDGRMA